MQALFSGGGGDWNAAETVVGPFGGQATINVNIRWPDSTSFACAACSEHLMHNDVSWSADGPM